MRVAGFRALLSLVGRKSYSVIALAGVLPLLVTVMV
jgi:hypothetical protein